MEGLQIRAQAPIVREPAHSFYLQFKSVDDEKREIEGYASTSAIDRVDEVIEPSAFERSLKQFVKTGVILAYHDFRQPIGKPVKAEIDEKGLWIRARIATGTSPDDAPEKVWNLVKQGVLTAFSVGFRPLAIEDVDAESRIGKRGARRRITDLDLYETSIVPIPANVPSQFTVAKSLALAAVLFEQADSQEGASIDRERILRARCALARFRMSSRRAGRAVV